MNKIKGSEIKSFLPGKKVYLQFSANWCGPCKNLKRLVESVESEYDAIDFCYVDVDECDPEITRIFGIRSIPHTYLFNGPDQVSEFKGAVQMARLKDELNKL